VFSLRRFDLCFSSWGFAKVLRCIFSERQLAWIILWQLGVSQSLLTQKSEVHGEEATVISLYAAKLFVIN
jgi:hypothetical protein